MNTNSAIRLATEILETIYGSHPTCSPQSPLFESYKDMIQSLCRKLETMCERMGLDYGNVLIQADRLVNPLRAERAEAIRRKRERAGLIPIVTMKSVEV
jgi:hypothetical protein